MNVHLKLLSPEASFSPKCTKYRLAARLCHDPLGSLQRSPDPLAGFKGPTSIRAWQEEEGRGREGEEGVRREEGISLCVIGLRGWTPLLSSYIQFITRIFEFRHFLLSF